MTRLGVHRHAKSHESDPQEIRDGFKELDDLLGGLSLDDNNTVWNLCANSVALMSAKLLLTAFNMVLI